MFSGEKLWIFPVPKKFRNISNFSIELISFKVSYTHFSRFSIRNPNHLHLKITYIPFSILAAYQISLYHPSHMKNFQLPLEWQKHYTFLSLPF